MGTRNHRAHVKFSGLMAAVAHRGAAHSPPDGDAETLQDVLASGSAEVDLLLADDDATLGAAAFTSNVADTPVGADSSVGASTNISPGATIAAATPPVRPSIGIPYGGGGSPPTAAGPRAHPTHNSLNRHSRLRRTAWRMMLHNPPALLQLRQTTGHRDTCREHRAVTSTSKIAVGPTKNPDIICQMGALSACNNAAPSGGHGVENLLLRLVESAARDIANHVVTN